MKPRRLPTRLQVDILIFLWRWKLANFMVLKTSLAPNKSYWKFYQRLRQLAREGYISEEMDMGFKSTVWILTKKGFNFLYGRSDQLEQSRFKVQSMNHDYWGTAFHLGDFVFGLPQNVELVTEQEINAKSFESLPPWIPQSKTHIPDGLTRIKKNEAFSVVAFEVETSQKTTERYDTMIYFLDKSPEIQLVFWLCETERIIQKITSQIIVFNRNNISKHNFILKSDFQKLGWQSPIRWGGKATKNIAQVMTELGVNGMGHALGNKVVTAQQHRAIDLFNSKIKSPRSLKA